MKIVRIIARLNVGGPAQHVVWLTAGLRHAGHDTVLVTGTEPPGEGSMAAFAEQRGVQPLVIPELSRDLSLRDAIVVWKLFNVFRRERPDVIHTHTAKAGAVGRAAALVYSAVARLPWNRWPVPRTIHTYHGHVFHGYFGRVKTSVFLFIERALASLATDRIVVISEQQRREICEQFRVGVSDQFVTVPLGMDLVPYTPVLGRRDAMRASLGVTSETVLIGIVGRLTDIKQHELFVSAAAAMARRAKPGTLRFIVVGDGPRREMLEKQAAHLGLAITFLGDRRDMPAVYAALDLVALTSRNEGTPLSLIEGMASGVPFVSTAVGGVIDLAGEHVERLSETASVHAHGVLVRNHEPEAFASALDYLADRAELRVTMGTTGRAFVARQHSLDRLVQDIVRLYSGFLSRRSLSGSAGEHT